MDFSEPDHDFYLSMLNLMAEAMKKGKITPFIEEFDPSEAGFGEIVDGMEKERKSDSPRLNVVKELTFKLMAHLRFFQNYRLLSVNGGLVKLMVHSPFSELRFFRRRVRIFMLLRLAGR